MIMSKYYLILLNFSLFLLLCGCQTQIETQTETYHSKNFLPAEDLGPVFHDVQMKQVFSDSKTFADCVPKYHPEQIKERYQLSKQEENFNLENFVTENFIVPPTTTINFESSGLSLQEHLPNHWNYLTRNADTMSNPGSLLPLPHSYVVPGGRFREIYYWDSYFTMLGLFGSDRSDLAVNMIDNFAHLINTYGFIPNGNRTYYLSRSQPPFFTLMVMLLAENKGIEAALPYLNSMELEYNFWMDGLDSLNEVGDTYKKLVMVGPDQVLNRYWDNSDQPRTESYREDVELAEELPEVDRPMLYRNLRSACESGWDFSSRWLKDPNDLSTIVTTEIIPVDLNSLLYFMESSLAQLYAQKGESGKEESYNNKAAARKIALLKFCWSDAHGYFMDYHFPSQKPTSVFSTAGVYPLYFQLATPAQASKSAKTIESKLLSPGGIVSTTNLTGQQWDYPNGWAPQQWMAIEGLGHYNEDELATEISVRWLKVNQEVFQSTGKMMEKYNVVDLNVEDGGGEYPTQDGFGWTNGVAISLLKEQ